MPSIRAALLITFALAAAGLPGKPACSQPDDDEPTLRKRVADAGAEGRADDARAPVRVETAVAGEISMVRRALGSVGIPPGAPGIVAARVAGAVTSLDTAGGAVVAADDPIAHLDDRAAKEAFVKAELLTAAAQRELERAETFSLPEEQRSLEAEVEQTAAAASVAAQESQRRAGLRRDGLTSERAALEAEAALGAARRTASVSRRRLDEFVAHGRETELARLRAAVALAAADVEPARRAQADAVIRAPVAGRVCALEARLGGWVEVGARVATIIDAAGARARTSVPTSVAEALSPSARVRIAGSEAWTGRVRLHAPVSQTESGFAVLWVELDAAAGPFRLDQPVALEIEVGAPMKGVVLPASALDGREDPPYVALVVDGVAKVREVHVLARDAARVVVASDEVPAGSAVVVEGGYNLPDGRSVRVEEPGK